MTLWIAMVLGLRGAIAVLVLTALVTGMPRVVQLGLVIGVGVWSAMMIGGEGLGGLSSDGVWLVGAREVVLGATLGVMAALPVLAAATAGRLVAATGVGASRAAYRTLFGILAAAVFVGIDGHVALLGAIVRSFEAVPSSAVASAVGAARLGALATLGRLVPTAVQLAIPWLITAAVVEIAVGMGLRLAGRAGLQGPTAAAAPAALVMMTASLVGTLAVAIAMLVRSVG